MCIVLFSYKNTPGYRLILAANRDEFLARPTAPLSWWSDNTTILAGRDIQDGGTWLGVSRNGKFGVLTNYRDFPVNDESPVSRGEILSEYLSADSMPSIFIQGLRQRQKHFRGYNLLLGDASSLWYYSNRRDDLLNVPPGIHGLSNHLLNTGWPKVERGKMLFTDAVRDKDFSRDSLIEVLRDTVQPIDSELPDTGVGSEWEKRLGPIFITSDEYGTRSSAILTIADNGEITFYERTYGHDAHGAKTETERCFTVESY
jgi:uncharacterized protein with NRDE domain